MAPLHKLRGMVKAKQKLMRLFDQLVAFIDRTVLVLLDGVAAHVIGVTA